MTTALIPGFRTILIPYSHLTYPQADVDAYIVEQMGRWDALFTALGIPKYTSPPGQVPFTTSLAQPSDIGGVGFTALSTVTTISSSTSGSFRVTLTVNRAITLKALKVKMAVLGG